MQKIKAILKLLRIKHYIKNLLIFAPLFFTGNVFNSENITDCFLGFISFCLISSCIYIVNDVKDVEKDRLHPTKKNRPIANKTISVTTGIIFAALCFTVSILIIVYEIYIRGLSYLTMMYILIYFIINIAYSFGLKNIPIIDVALLMTGFLLRILFGAVLGKTFVSAWLYLTVISGAFYMGLGKRRNEFHSQDKATNTRSVLSLYNFAFLDKFMYICLSMTIIFYSLWAKEYQNPHVIWTVPLVIIIAMQYSLDVEGDSDGDPIEVILKDKKLIFSVLILLLSLVGILYI